MLIENDYDARAELAVEQITEHGLFSRIPESEAKTICETIEFLRLHAGALEHQLNMLRNSKCGWMPIDDAPKFSGTIYIWDNDRLMEASWHQLGGEWQWCEFFYDKDWGDSFYVLSEQPKYYLALSPPPDA